MSWQASYTAKPLEIKRKWHSISAANQPLGRLASRVATLLRGKHKAIYTPHVDTGDFVIVTDAAQIRLSGKKAKDKIYYRYSGYLGGMKRVSAETLLAKDPTALVKLAVQGMLPKGSLGRQMFKKLKVYADGNHPHTSQQPERLELC